MAHLDWLLICDLAYFDCRARMCMVGITTQYVVPSLPVELRQVMMVAHVADTLPEQLEIRVAISTPLGLWARPSRPDAIQIEGDGGYLIVTFRDLPLTDEGTYHFSLHLGDEPPIIAGVDVRVATPEGAEVH